MINTVKKINLKQTMALYVQTALDHIEKIQVTQTKDKDLKNNKKDIEQSVACKDKDSLSVSSAHKLYTHFFFVERLFSDVEFKANKNITERTSEALSIEENQARELAVWIRLLKSLRNYCSHDTHSEPVTADYKSIRDLLEQLYLEAVHHAKNRIPDKYQNTGCLYRIYKEQEYFSFTAQVFIICLFLEKGMVNDFLEALEIEHLPEASEEERAAFRLRANPGDPYPEHLRSSFKKILYARDVYTYWAVRGHRSYLPVTFDSIYKEKYFSILEYLKRIPGERLTEKNADYKKIERQGSENDTRKHFQVELPIDGKVHSFDVREKNRFMEWALEFWETEYKACLEEKKGIKWKWEWARHAAVVDKKEKKEAAMKRERQAGRVSERIHSLRRHEKIVWQIPEDEELRLNDNGSENGYPYYFEKDDNGEYSQALFRCTYVTENNETQSVIGLMGRKVLCSILEDYLVKFPTNKQDNNLDSKRKFFLKNIHYCYKYIANDYPKSIGKKERHLITSQEIEQRIAYLRRKYEQQSEETNLHKRIITIANTWNQMITCGAPINPLHALDCNGSIGGKNAYQEIIRRLSLMSPSLISLEDEQCQKQLQKSREEKAKALIDFLKSLRGRTQNSYYQQINNCLNFGVDKRLATVVKKDVANCHTIKELFEQCMRYRMDTLQIYTNRLRTAPFNPKDWKPNAEMRWLGLKDARTPQAAQSKEAPPKPLTTGILNVDRHQHSAVGLALSLNRPSHQKLYPSSGNMMIIPEFYTPQNRLVWEEMTGPQKKRLYQVRREDTLLSHIANYYGCKAEIPAGGISLIDRNFQNIQIQVPVVNPKEKPPLAYISFYYRHFKQNRYRLPHRITVGIIKILVERNLIKRGDEIPHNNLHLVSKVKLNEAEKLSYFSEKSYRSLSREEKLYKIDEKLSAISSDMVFIPNEDKSKYYISDLLTSYTICRKVFIKKVLCLENAVIKKYSLQRKKDKHYLDFNEIADAISEKELLDTNEIKLLKSLRNAAFHSDVPATCYLPEGDDLIKQTNKKPAKDYLDIFGKGFLVIDKCMREIRNR